MISFLSVGRRKPNRQIMSCHVTQLVEHLITAQVVVDSSSTSHPTRPKQQFSIICFGTYKMKGSRNEMNKKIYKQAMKKTGDELQEWLQFKRRGSSVQAKKGRGSCSRKQKYKDREC